MQPNTGEGLRCLCVLIGEGYVHMAHADKGYKFSRALSEDWYVCSQSLMKH